MMNEMKYNEAIKEFKCKLLPDKSGYVISGYRGAEKDATIPPEISGHPVTTIAAGEYPLDSLVIPESVTNIQAHAFYCQPIKNIVFKGLGLRHIGFSAFSNTALESLSLPDTVEIIDDYAFANSPIVTAKWPNQCKTIPHNAFAGCEKLSTVTGTESVLSIGVDAFADCVSLKKLDITNVNTLHVGSFRNTPQLTICIPDEVKCLPCECFGQTTITNEKISAVMIDDKALCGCKLQNHVHFPKLTSLQTGAFVDMHAESVSFSSALKTIEDGAFYDSQYLNEIILTNIAPEFLKKSFYFGRKDVVTSAVLASNNTLAKALSSNGIPIKYRDVISSRDLSNNEKLVKWVAFWVDMYGSEIINDGAAWMFINEIDDNDSGEYKLGKLYQYDADIVLSAPLKEGVPIVDLLIEAIHSSL